MFGSYPYPPNALEQNTVEFINVLVKKGKPDQISKAIKQASLITSKEWMNLTKQVWKLYPADVKRTKHPAPFPVALANRLIAMYTFARAKSSDASFDGDIVLDPFVGTGATCIAAVELGRQYIGIDLVPDFCIEAAIRLERHRFTGEINTKEYGSKNSQSNSVANINQLELKSKK